MMVYFNSGYCCIPYENSVMKVVPDDDGGYCIKAWCQGETFILRNFVMMSSAKTVFDNMAHGYSKGWKSIDI